MDIWNLLRNLAIVVLMAVALMATLGQGLDLPRMQVLVFMMAVVSNSHNRLIES
ncbi:MAG TPA: hypothetical protein VMX96_04470 [Dehalococcoidia bacterium]|nr:hypothetical protein [Dehalococcoidia bacterium]